MTSEKVAGRITDVQDTETREGTSWRLATSAQRGSIVIRKIVSKRFAWAFLGLYAYRPEDAERKEKQHSIKFCRRPYNEARETID